MTDFVRLAQDTLTASEGVTEGPWSWMDCGEKDNSWALGLAVHPTTETPLTGNVHDWEQEWYDEETGEAPQAVVVECVAENFASNANPADARFIALMRTAGPVLAQKVLDQHEERETLLELLADGVTLLKARVGLIADEDGIGHWIDTCTALGDSVG